MIGLGCLYRQIWNHAQTYRPRRSARSSRRCLENWRSGTYEARMIIEARSPCWRASGHPKDIERLVGLNELMHQQYDNEQHYWESIAIPQLLATIAGNQILRTVQIRSRSCSGLTNRSTGGIISAGQTYAWHKQFDDSVGEGYRGCQEAHPSIPDGVVKRLASLPPTYFWRTYR